MLLMFVAEKVLLLLVISLTDKQNPLMIFDEIRKLHQENNKFCTHGHCLACYLKNAENMMT